MQISDRGTCMVVWFIHIKMEETKMITIYDFDLNISIYVRESFSKMSWDHNKNESF